MLKILLCRSLLLLFFIQAPVVMAATFDFVRYADGTRSAPENNEKGYKVFQASEDNIALKARGYKWEDKRWEQTSAYLDHGNAGLAVCNSGLTSSGQCKDSSDDSMSYKKMLWLSFDQVVSLDQVVFRNGQHGTSFKGNFLMTIFSEGSWGNWTKYALSHVFNTDFIGEAFAFYNPMNSSSAKKQFYLSSMTVTNVAAVPLPSAIWLFGSVILGFIAVGKRSDA